MNRTEYSAKHREISDLFLSLKDDKKMCQYVSYALYDMTDFSIGDQHFKIISSVNIQHPSAVYKMNDGTLIMWTSQAADSWNTEEIYDEPSSWLQFEIVIPKQITLTEYVRAV